MGLTEIVRNYNPKFVTKDLVMEFGDKHDGAIEFAGLVNNGVIEVGYFYGDIKPKNIIVISSQVGCPAKCSFCELGSEKFTRSLSPQEMFEQVVLMLQTADRYGINVNDIGHKVSFAKSGDPLFNKHIVEGLERIAELQFSFKVSTVFPQNKIEQFTQITQFAAQYGSSIQIQVSLISTSEEYRAKTVGIPVASFREIRAAAEYWQENNPRGRKINLSLILTDDVPCDVNEVSEIFPPDLFRFRFRNYVPTENGANHGLVTITSTRFTDVKESFRQKGYEVGDWATPTPIEQRFGLASNVTRSRYLKMISGKF